MILLTPLSHIIFFYRVVRSVSVCEFISLFSDISFSRRYKRNPMFAFVFEERLFVFRHPNPAFVPLLPLPPTRASLTQPFMFYFISLQISPEHRTDLHRVSYSVFLNHGTSGTQCSQSYPRNDNTCTGTRTPQTSHHYHHHQQGQCTNHLHLRLYNNSSHTYR